MKIGFECPECLIHRGFIEIQKATIDTNLRKIAMIETIKQISKELSEDSVPSFIGTKRDRIIRSITKNSDPFIEDKIKSNRMALKILPLVEHFISDGEDAYSRLERALLASIVGNCMEFGILGYDFHYDDLINEVQKAKTNLAINDIEKIYEQIIRSKEILFLTDNAGEIVFDKLLIEEIKFLDLRITVAVKDSPVSNDATLEDAKIARIDRVADRLITTGSDALGFIPEYCSKEFLEVFNKSDFIITKGMAHLETLTEYKNKPLGAMLLRAKCNPIANYLGVQMGQNVAKIFKTT
jgi:uncharacterized protein with ATP-grasp and redox domains